ncbi:hypothetical protein [Nocardia altamirensis]|uniref:hypothetical protein n=1 Tax=Nocardia altamirensis TaxID=472158 RepID=UPI00114CB66A|nr:hypothetical protein [Nocardia altamirensis]
MRHRRSRLIAMAGALLITATGCIGAVDRADFEAGLRARGGGLVTALPTTAIDTLRQRLGVTDIQASVLVLTAPDSTHSRQIIASSPQLTRYLADHPDLTGQDAAVRLRIRVPNQPNQQDDYTYANNALHGPTPVHVSAFDRLDDESFDLRDASGLHRLDQILDTARTEAALDNGYVPLVIVDRTAAGLRIAVTVTSPRSTVIAYFDGAGTFQRTSPA